MSLTIDLKAFPDPVQLPAEAPGLHTIVLGGGCFWCTEAVFRALPGVTAVRPGYAGGTAESADYKTVCTGRTDHAEVIEVTYDAARTGLGPILKVFFSIAHDPTQVDRQGGDIGRQYRSVVFYGDDVQRSAVAQYIRQLDEARVFRQPIATQLVPLEAFFVAEDYHHNYAAKNPNQPYIAGVALPKVAKLAKVKDAWLREPETAATVTPTAAE